MIGNFWAKRNLYFVFSAPSLPPSVQQTFQRHWAKERVVRKISSQGRVAGMSYICWAKESVATVLASESTVRYREVQGDRGGHTGSLGLRGRRENWSSPKYPRRTLAGKRRAREKKGKSRLGVGLEKDLLRVTCLKMGVIPFQTM